MVIGKVTKESSEMRVIKDVEMFEMDHQSSPPYFSTSQISHSDNAVLIVYNICFKIRLILHKTCFYPGRFPGSNHYQGQKVPGCPLFVT